MVESQKDLIEKILKEKNKSKRELAAFLGINENSINRTLRNKNIAISKLNKIANFLEVELSELLPPAAEKATDPRSTYMLTAGSFVVSENIVEKLSEALLAGNRTNEIMAENQKTQNQTINNLVRFITEKLS